MKDLPLRIVLQGVTPAGLTGGEAGAQVESLPVELET
jgi:hypothetical protein